MLPAANGVHRRGKGGGGKKGFTQLTRLRNTRGVNGERKKRTCPGAVSKGGGGVGVAVLWGSGAEGKGPRL